MLRIAICDDEKIFRKNIEKTLKKYTYKRGTLCEISIFSSGKEFLDLGIDMVKYKIVFLEINMNDLDGIQIAQRIREISNGVFIVFVTASDSYALDGYKVDAVRYILKNNVNFIESIHECMDAIIAKMNHVIEWEVFDFNEGTKKVSLDYLLYIESRLHKLEFNIMEESLNTYTLYGRLNEIEKELVGTDFVRIHQSYLVNMKHIKKISRYKVLLSNGLILNIPRARYKNVEETFIAYKIQRCDVK